MSQPQIHMNTKTKQTHPSRIFPGTIPDLWEIAHLPELKGYSLGGVSAKDLILEAWHLAHKLRDANEAAKGELSKLSENVSTFSPNRIEQEIKAVIEEIL